MKPLRLFFCEFVVFFWVILNFGFLNFFWFVDVCSLVSPLASYVSGHTLEVTGGAGI